MRNEQDYLTKENQVISKLQYEAIQKVLSLIERSNADAFSEMTISYAGNQVTLDTEESEAIWMTVSQLVDDYEFAEDNLSDNEEAE